MPQVPNIPKFWIWENSDYGKVFNMQALHSILNMLWQSSEYMLGSKCQDY